MGSLEKIDDKNFVIKIKNAGLRCVTFAHLDCSWRLRCTNQSTRGQRGYKRNYYLQCTKSDSEFWNIGASITLDLFKEDGTKGITRSIYTSFNSASEECALKVSFGVFFPVFEALYPSVEVHVKINSVTGFQKAPRNSNFERDAHLSDVALIVEEKRLFVNKAVLATFSPVFRAMFFSGFKESTDEEVVIKDAKYDDFLIFLQVMHDAYSKICEENVQSLLVLADRYDVGVVMEKCENYFLLTDDDDDDFTDPKYVELAETYNLPNLHKKCSDSIVQIRSRSGKIGDPTNSEVEIKIKPIPQDQRKSVKEFDKKDDQLSDFAFVFDERKLFVNKAVLATFSPVFREMFYSESKESTDKEVVIKDINYDDFEQFLQVVHSAYPSINEDNIENVLALADRYKADIAMEKCENYLLFTDNVENSDKLRLAETYSIPKLYEKVMDSIDTRDELTSLSYEKTRFGPLTFRAIIKKFEDFEEEDDRVAWRRRYFHYTSDYE